MSDAFRPPVRPPRCTPLAFTPTPAEVEALIAAARQHPLGLEYLRDGALDNVAITLHAHAFTVVAARELLSRLES